MKKTKLKIIIKKMMKERNHDKKKMFSEFINFLINLLFLFKNNSQNLLQKKNLIVLIRYNFSKIMNR